MFRGYKRGSESEAVFISEFVSPILWHAVNAKEQRSLMALMAVAGVLPRVKALRTPKEMDLPTLQYGACASNYGQLFGTFD